MVFYICSSTGQGRTQVSNSIRTTAQPPRGAGRPSGCVRGPRGSSGGDSVVKIVGGPDVACGFAAAERPRVRGAAPRRARPEMVPQPSEKAQFAPGNGAPIGLRGAPQDAPLPGVARTGAETGLAFAGAAHRPEMAPQRIEKTRIRARKWRPLGSASLQRDGLWKRAARRRGSSAIDPEYRDERPAKRASRGAMPASWRPTRRKSRSWR